VNAKTLEGALDPLALAISATISAAAIAAGVFTIIRSQSFDFQVNSLADFAGVFTGGRLNVRMEGGGGGWGWGSFLVLVLLLVLVLVCVWGGGRPGVHAAL
jgi:ribose/xylose/arabinose/galactoside ABC-type transport system permease subunit